MVNGTLNVWPAPMFVLAIWMVAALPALENRSIPTRHRHPRTEARTHNGLLAIGVTRLEFGLATFVRTHIRLATTACYGMTSRLSPFAFFYKLYGLASQVKQAFQVIYCFRTRH